jgi:tetratricopeptide (TPR) repeat protein
MVRMEAIVSEIESLIRGGKFVEAEKLIHKLDKKDRKNAVVIANFARRISQPGLSVKILNPIVRPKYRNQDPATPSEKIEYAEGLRRLGAVDEAWHLLNEVESGLFPHADLYKVFCLFNQWKYKEALPILRVYVSNKNLDPYDLCVGEVNLAAALIQVGDLQEAEELLRFLRKATQDAGFFLLLGNCLELTSQILILKNDLDGAIALLSESSQILKSVRGLFSLFVEKWMAIAISLKQGRTTQELRDVLLKAHNEKHWETIRDCDLYIAFLDKDKPRFEHLYFGTPFESFRKRIFQLAGPFLQVTSKYTWSSSSKPHTLFNLSTGSVLGLKQGRLPLGQAMHRFMILLTQDLYRPVPILTAFGKLFPGEYMNTITSVNRVHQIVKRCRQWFEEVGLNLQIEEQDGAYRIVLGEGVGLVLPVELLPLEGKELEWLCLKDQVGSEPFKIQKAMELLASSTSSAQRLLRWGMETGRIQKAGKGSRTLYQVIS